VTIRSLAFARAGSARNALASRHHRLRLVVAVGLPLPLQLRKYNRNLLLHRKVLRAAAVGLRAKPLPKSRWLRKPHRFQSSKS
jgi:hypothetical protein